MVTRKFILATFFFLTLFSAPTAPAASSDSFDAAAQSYRALEDNLRAGQDPAKWRKVAAEFLSSAPGRKPDESYYMAALSYERAHRISSNASDVGEAMKYYSRVFAEHRDSPLADDALFRTARLGENVGDLSKAREYYKKTYTLYPDGDMAALAKESYDKVGKTVEVNSFRHWSGQAYTRIVFELSGLTPFEANSLSSNEKAGKSVRIFADIKRAVLSKSCEESRKIDDGLVTQVRVSQNTKDTVRVVLDLKEKSDYRVFPLLDPARLVIDVIKDVDEKDLISSLIEQNEKLNGKKENPAQPSVEPAAAAKGAVAGAVVNGALAATAITGKALSSAAQSAAPAPERETARKEPEKTLKRKFRIVIDPGHGGKDPGAIGVGGLKEKDVVLAIALEVRKLLEKNGDYEIKLTRTVDEELSLARRTAIANSFGADIFVSIHANANRSRKARGIETFYLDRASDKAARRIAAIENNTSETGVLETEQILADVLLNMKLPESKRLAEAIQKELLGRVVDNFGPVRDLGVRRAPFHVLTGAIMPAVLLETAFISNPVEAEWLKDGKFRTTVAEAVANAVGIYSSGY